MGNFSSVVNEQTCNTLQQLVLWKDTRVVPSDESLTSVTEQSESENETVIEGNDEPVISTNTGSHSTENDDSGLNNKSFEDN